MKQTRVEGRKLPSGLVKTWGAECLDCKSSYPGLGEGVGRTIPGDHTAMLQQAWLRKDNNTMNIQSFIVLFFNTRVDRDPSQSHPPTQLARTAHSCTAT